MNVNVENDFKSIIFNIKSEEQRQLLKLYSNYKKIKSYENYEELEKDAYAKQFVNNDKDKIKFELQRIKEFIKTNNIDNSNIYERLYLIVKTFMIYSKFEEENIGNSALKDIIESIILLEIDLEMKIGLYKELCECFEKRISNNNDKGKNRQEYRKKGNG